MSGNAPLPQINNISPTKPSSSGNGKSMRQSAAERSPAAERFDQMLREAQQPDRNDQADRRLQESRARAAAQRKTQLDRDKPSRPEPDRDRPRTDLDRPDRSRSEADRADRTDRADDRKPVDSTDDKRVDDSAESESTETVDESGTEEATGDATEDSETGEGTEENAEVAECEGGHAVDAEIEMAATVDAAEGTEAIELRPIPIDQPVVDVDDSEIVSEIDPELMVQETEASADDAEVTEEPVIMLETDAEPEVDDTIQVTEAEVAVEEVDEDDEDEAPVAEEASEEPVIELNNPMAATAAAQPTVRTDSELADGDAEATEAVAGVDGELAETVAGGTMTDADTADEQAAPDIDMTELEGQSTDEAEQGPTLDGGTDEAVVQPGPVVAPTVTTGNTTAAAANAAVGQLTATEAAAPTAEAAAPAPAAPAAEEGDQLWQQVRRAIGSMRLNTEGDQQMTIRLRPAELGSVVVRVTTGEAGTAVSLVAESSAAANQLNQQRQQLISDLEETGIGSVNVDIDSSGDPDQAESDEAGEDGDGAPRSGLNPTMSDRELVRNYSNRRDRGATSGLVDVDL